MAKLVDCPSCGGLLPVGQRCCPHCHCRYSRWRRVVLLLSAAFGMAGCGSTNIVHYGSPPGFISDGGVDASVPDLGSGHDLSRDHD
jgi:hypothetical protein